MKKLTSIFLLLLAMTASYQVQAAEDDKPFAEEKIVLQISDPNPFKQTLVLNVASNLVNTTVRIKLISKSSPSAPVYA